ncbi:hypothetical protein OPT61_g10484 [Boeremia exigua]|uniref:Uncharacterized protein n=1 Tax=Boeremia exigua TaxID=749465 RepID=A0ACC2HPJ6_9PLEO|nr:hypothetical protein OPT61_g10484 [Boeremia exigua]
MVLSFNRPSAIKGTKHEGGDILRALFLPAVSEIDNALDDDDIGGISLETDNVKDGMPFGMPIPSYAEDAVRFLLLERDSLEAEVARLKETYEDLEQRVSEKQASGHVDPPATARRLKRLQNEAERSQSENEKLRGFLKVAESEATTLKDKISGLEKKLKHAQKTVRNAKDVADQHEQKTQSAVQDK